MIVLLISMYVVIGHHQVVNQDLIFTNKNPSASLQLMEIKNGQTFLYTISEGKPKLFASWNQVPANYDNTGSRSRYKMIVEKKEPSVLRVFEISYLMDRQNGQASAYIKSTFLYNDSRGKQNMEDYFVKAK